MSLELGLGQVLVAEARVTPKQIVANKVLAMSSAALQETIAQELEENPALERLAREFASSLASTVLNR